jgi:hypothetical protein
MPVGVFTPQASSLPAYRPVFRAVAPHLGSSSLGLRTQYVGLRKALGSRQYSFAAAAQPSTLPRFRRGALQVSD